MNATKYKQKMLKNTFDKRAKFINTHDCKSHDCEICSEPIIFALSTENGENFSIGLTTVLECLRIAQEQGHVPDIDEETEFWCKMVGRYGVGYPAVS
ncbi:MAG: hypothetical protein FWG63_11585 [Defluviitaleaceae bacterium]|nr:hypothetical protein [Defluviitaleaceae bacterium]